MASRGSGPPWILIRKAAGSNSRTSYCTRTSLFQASERYVKIQAVTRPIRLYFNRRGQLPWSVDEGAGTHERLFATVAIGAVGGVTIYATLEPNQSPTETPCAWIEYRNCEVATSGSRDAPIGYILPIRSR